MGVGEYGPIGVKERGRAVGEGDGSLPPTNLTLLVPLGSCRLIDRH